MQQLGEVRYLNSAGVRLPMVLFPNPDGTIQRILLVTNRAAASPRQ